MKIAVPSGYNNTPVEVLIVGQNSIEDFSNVKTIKMDYSIGKLVAFIHWPEVLIWKLSSTKSPIRNLSLAIRRALSCVNHAVRTEMRRGCRNRPPISQPISVDEVKETNAPTTTTQATTTAEDPLNNLVEVFTVAVDENHFVDTHYDTLKGNIQRFASNCTVEFDKSTGGNPVSCREECWMTDSEKRGCVLVKADVVRDIYCPYSNRRKFVRLNKIFHQFLELEDFPFPLPHC